MHEVYLNRINIKKFSVLFTKKNTETPLKAKQ